MTNAKWRSGSSKPKRVSKDTGTKSNVQQSFKDECDINKIIKTYDKTGVINHVNGLQAQYGDFSELKDYHGSYNQILEAQASFDALPAVIRKRFNNDPGELLKFVADEKNVDEMVELGLATKKNVPASPNKAEQAAEKQAEPASEAE